MNGLKKNDSRHQVNPDQLEALASGSAMTTMAATASQSVSKKPVKRVAVFKAYTFSLTETVSDDIDDLCLTKRKINRSDVIKCGVIALQRMTKSERIALMGELK